jgi:hypothetical protein
MQFASLGIAAGPEVSPVDFAIALNGNIRVSNA